MNAEQRRLAREIFADALEKAQAGERAAFLEAACGGDGELRQFVEALLQAHERAGGFLNGEPETASGCPLGEGPGTVIGRYKLLQEIGEGGFGLVFMAEQLVPVKRKVALKIIKAGMDTREVIARFEAERQALALMDHPNIARVLDAGATESGRPYFVMELVKGIRITDYCDQKHLSTEERLQLFIQVCHAVQHAHQKGVIHRDLKPANILVTMIDGEAAPKVIDFGIAKAMGHRLTEKTLFTRFEVMIGTPAYLSPEQTALSGVDVDTRTDIYSLGVLLYELLTGVTPLDKDTLARAAYDEIRRMIQETEPPKPSTRLHTLGEKVTDVASRRQADPATLRRALRGDLDWIVMKALEKDRRRRYASANDLAEDVERHLNHEPVLARPPSRTYRAGKFVRRHRGGVAFAAAIAVILIVGVTATTTALIQAHRERNRALAAENKAEATLRRLDLQTVKESLARNETVRAVATLAMLLRQSPSDRAVSGWLVNVLTHRSFPLPLAPPLEHEDVVNYAGYSPDGRRVLTLGRDNRARLWDPATGQLAGFPLEHDPALVQGNGFLGSIHPLEADFSPNGLYLATGSIDRTARVWEAVSGKAVTPPMPHPDWVTWVRFSPDGQLLATACKDGAARLWKAATGEATGPVFRHMAWVNSVAFSPDGRLLLTSSDDKSAQVWEVATGRPTGQALRHENSVKAAAFSPDGRRIVTASADNTARLWDGRSGEALSAPLAHENTVVAVCFSPDGARVATCSFDRTARLWDGFDGRPLCAPLRHQDTVRSVRFSPEGTRLISASEDKTARVWDVNTGTPLTEPMVHHGPVWSAEFSPDGQSIVTASSDKTAQVWDARPGQALAHCMPSDWRVLAAHWSPDRKRALVVCPQRTRVWDAETGQVQGAEDPALALQNQVLSAQFSADGERIVTASADQTARVWDGRGMRALTRAMKHAGAVNHAEFSPDGRWIATASADRTARVWNSTNASPITPPLRHEDAVLMARFSPDGRLLITAGTDNTARFWSVPRGQAVGGPLRHQDQVVSARFSPNGRFVVTASSDHSAQVWESGSAQPAGPRLRHLGPVTAAEFSPDGRWVVTASADGTARVWEWIQGRAVGEPLTHETRVLWAEFSPDGLQVLTSSRDGAASLWDAASGLPLSPRFQHRLAVNHAEFSRDGQFVLTAGFDHMARLWNIAQISAATPGWLAELAEAVVGERLTTNRLTEDVSAGEFIALKQHLGALPGEDAYARWARWFLADRSTRNVSPSARRTVQQFQEDLLAPWRLEDGNHYLERFAEAARLAPTNGLVFAQQAFVLAKFAFTNSAKQLPTLTWLTERATTLAPAQPMAWTARALYQQLAGETNAALQAFERGSPLFRTNALCWREYASLLEKVGRLDAAYQATGYSDEMLWDQARLLWRHGDLNSKYRPEWWERYRRCTPFPVRPPDCPPQLVDLTEAYVSALDDLQGTHDLSRQTLKALPHGRAHLGPIEFDVRGVVKLRSAQLSSDYGTERTGISVKQRCRRLHFLHATDVAETDGKHVASYVIHYTDGQKLEVPLLQGRNIQEWLSEDDSVSRDKPTVAWRHSPGGGITLQLSRFTWDNPRPDMEITTLDFVSKMTQAAPYLLAITAEP